MTKTLKERLEEIAEDTNVNAAHRIDAITELRQIEREEKNFQEGRDEYGRIFPEKVEDNSELKESIAVLEEKIERICETFRLLGLHGFDDGQQ